MSAVLLQIDPTQAIIAPWMQLGIVGSVVIALAVVVVWQRKRIDETQAAHLAEVKSCAAQTMDLMLKKIASDDKLADALGAVERIVETALNTMKRT